MRLSIGALGLIGAGIALRSIRFATKFFDNNRIPNSFIKKSIALRGVVKSVSTDGSLNIDHLPIIPMPWHRRVNNDRLLNISLAAIKPSISGTFWLKLNVENKIVWFKAINRLDGDIKCLVSNEKKNWWREDSQLLDHSINH
ncbi:unnamed protein product [Medioppia subpectinata]|uniref:Uncharacterized protein n=1 Tax=Medioppia subpectinata TaxID=1979941 RepID=A0A7R9LWM4_9ACAR|nr:unnamed protein product [Medioppia subpectinata]CAG2122326.1 unnamed protein product [Medioppia subpectinata]